MSLSFDTLCPGIPANIRINLTLPESIESLRYIFAAEEMIFNAKMRYFGTF